MGLYKKWSNSAESSITIQCLDGKKLKRKKNVKKKKYPVSPTTHKQDIKVCIDFNKTRSGLIKIN